jgi:hypothetical protein
MAVFYRSLMSHFPGVLLRYFLNDFCMAPVALVITGITFVFSCHIHCSSVVRITTTTTIDVKEDEMGVACGMWHVACVGQKTNACTVLVAEPEGENPNG